MSTHVRSSIYFTGLIVALDYVVVQTTTQSDQRPPNLPYAPHQRNDQIRLYGENQPVRHYFEQKVRQVYNAGLKSNK